MKKTLVICLCLFVVLFVVYEVILVLDKHLGYGRMRETPGVRPYEQVLPPMDERVVPFSGGEAFYRSAGGEELKSPLNMGDPDVIERGKSQYLLYCAQCHGKNHDGNAPVGQSFSPLPTDLRNPRVQALPEGIMFKEISYGIPKPDNRQPPLATTIDVQERWRIVAYLKALGPRD